MAMPLRFFQKSNICASQGSSLILVSPILSAFPFLFLILFHLIALGMGNRFQSEPFGSDPLTYVYCFLIGTDELMVATW